MDLQEFITETLTQIVAGVQAAQSGLKERGAIVGPQLKTTHEHGAKLGFLLAGDEFIPIVQFDVALTVVETKGTKGALGIFTGALNLGTVGQSQTENSTVSRVRFNVPMSLPYRENQ